MKQGTYSLASLRESIIRQMDEPQNASDFAAANAEVLFNLGLNMYSGSFTPSSAIYNAFARSAFDAHVSLHPDQIRAINVILENDASIISAPTSFGKTFCVFEYLARYRPNTVVLVVPTLALRREYISAIMNHLKGENEYQVYSDIPDQPLMNAGRSIFVLTHERVIRGEVIETLPQAIDFLVIDEVYKLGMDPASEGRILVLNIAYYLLAKRARKYLLLAPFISGVADREKLEKKPSFFQSDFGPVINNIHEIEIVREDDRFPETTQLLSKRCLGKKTLVYFPGPNDIVNYLKGQQISLLPSHEKQEALNGFLDWAKREISPDWSIVKAAERGLLVHHGQMPLGVRDYLLSVFNRIDSGYDVLLCTSTLLEGVNTSSKNLIITRAKRKSIKANQNFAFTAFDFYNLAGRTGRLNRYLVGDVYYLRTKDDPSFRRADANVTIRFQITDSENSDIDLHINEARNSPDVAAFFKDNNLDMDSYLKEFGPTFKFKQLQTLTESLATGDYAHNFSNEYRAVETLCSLSKSVFSGGVHPYCAYKVMSDSKATIRSLVESIKASPKNQMSVDEIINQIVKVKTSVLEHRVLPCARYAAFYYASHGRADLSDAISKNVISVIAKMFYLDNPAKRMLKAIGVYDGDIDTILSCTGEGFASLTELKRLLATNYPQFADSVGFISRFEIQRFISGNSD